jgi:iron complex transport system substrate-binding protein
LSVSQIMEPRRSIGGVGRGVRNIARIGLSPALVALLLGAALTACSDRAHHSDATPADSSQRIVLTDAVGRQVSLAAPAHRIGSLAPNLTEILFAIGAGRDVVGRTAFCNYPPEASGVDVISDLSSPNYERIVRLKPDLVLMTFAGNSSAAYNRLVDLGLQPYSLAAETIPGTLAAIDTIGRLVGRRDDAQRLVARLQRSIDSVRALAATLPRVSAFIVLDRAPLMTVSGGFINEALEIAGGENIAAGDPSAYPRFSREEVLRRDPDVIIVPADTAVSTASLLASFPEWSRLRAVRNGRVRALPPDVIFRPGPRLGRSVELIFSALHGR